MSSPRRNRSGGAPRPRAPQRRADSRLVPVLARARARVGPWLVRVGEEIGRAGTRLSRAAWRYRSGLLLLSQRIMWWAALGLLLLGGRTWLRGVEVGEIHQVCFAVGVVLCAVVLVSAAELRLRVAAFALASGHGAFGLVAWLVSQP